MGTSSQKLYFDIRNDTKLTGLYIAVEKLLAILTKIFI